jgi:hypothetical protein
MIVMIITVMIMMIIIEMIMIEMMICVYAKWKLAFSFDCIGMLIDGQLTTITLKNQYSCVVYKHLYFLLEINSLAQYVF